MLLLAFIVSMLNMAIHLPTVLKAINNEPLIEIDSEGFLLNTSFFSIVKYAGSILLS